MKVIVLVSGGMDSVVALHHIHKEGHEILRVLSFDYQSKHNAREIPFAAFHASLLGLRHTIIRLPFIGQEFSSNLLQKGDSIPDGHYAEDVMKQTVVPFRNGILLSIAAGIAESVGAEKIVIAAHAGDHTIYPDCRKEYMDAMDAAIRLGTWAGVSIYAPFNTWTKEDIAKRGAELGVDFSQTWSCYKGQSTHCGKCGTCIERREAFHLAGVEDPTLYSPDAPTLQELIDKGFHI